LTPCILMGQESVDFFTEWKWVDFSVEDLPPGRLEQMVDAGGVVWLRTTEAVAYYDNFQWVPLGLEKGFDDAGPVTSLFPDGDGGVVIVSGGDVFRGDTTGVALVLRNGDLTGWKPERAFPNPGGGLFLTASQPGTDIGHAFLFRDGEIRDVEPKVGITQSGKPAWYSRAGTVWVHSFQGLKRWTGSSWEEVTGPIPGPDSYQEVTLLFENSRGQGLAFRERPFRERGLLSWDAGRSPTLLSSEGRNDLLCGDVLEDGSAVMIWETGHVRVREGGIWRTVSMPNRRNQGLYFAHASPNGDLWLASALGLHWFRRSSLDRWVRWTSPFPNPRNRVNAIVTDPDGTVWTGSEAGVTRYVPNTRIDRYPALGEWVNPAITGLARDSAGGIWAVSGISFPGAFRWNGEEWSHWGEDSGLSAGTVHTIEVDAHGGVWFLALGSGQGEPGVFRLYGDSIVRWTDPEGFLDVQAYAMAEGPDGALWFGTRRGLARRTEEGEWSYWGRSDGVGSGGNPYVEDIAVDSSGRPWFVHGSEIGAGLGTLGPDGEVLYLTPADGLPSDFLRAVEVDDLARVWVSSPAGVVFLQDGFWNRIDGRNGLDSPSVWPIAWTDEHVLLGTMGGGLRGLSLSEASNPPPRVQPSSVMVDEGAARINWRVFPYQGEIPSNQVLSRYRLDDREWGSWSLENGVTLRGLEPGFHEVEIQARGLFGQYSREPTRTRLQIPLSLYRRPVFAIPVGVLLGLLLSGFLAYQIRKRRQDEALRESEERLRTLVEAAPEAIAIFDVDAGRFIDANANAATFFGLKKEMLLQLAPEELSPGVQPDGTSSVDAARSLLDAALEGESPLVQWEARRSDGTVVPCELSVVALPWKDRKLLRFSLVDISQRLEAEEHGKELEARLFQSQKLEAVGQLTGGVAHDFNNLLTVVLGNLELLREDLPENSPLQESARGAAQAAQRGALLTQRLLAFSRRQALEPRPVDANDLVSGILDLLRRTLGEDVTIETVLPADVWKIMVDPAQLESAILNLAINARDAMSQGGRLVIETMNTRIDDQEAGSELLAGDYLVLAVSDTGAGMSPEVVTRAFDPFFTTKEVGKGSGLGLSMVYGFAAQSGGTARIYSEEGMGTTVRLYFPRAEEDSMGVEAREAEDVLPDGDGERILVVEDEVEVRKTTAILLSRMGYETVGAGTADEALEILGTGEERVDLLFSDIVLPGGMNGVELAREARRLRPGLPVLFTSGYTEESILREGRLDPGFELVSKPFDRRILGRKIRETLAGS